MDHCDDVTLNNDWFTAFFYNWNGRKFKNIWNIRDIGINMCSEWAWMEKIKCEILNYLYNIYLLILQDVKSIALLRSKMKFISMVLMKF